MGERQYGRPRNVCMVGTRTADTRDAQHATAAKILARGSDYVATIKGKQPTLFRFSTLKKLFWKDVAATRRTERSHGRKITRTIKAMDAPGSVEFPGAA